jgi:protocatechuate 3,4-dioxygenase beta subunit
MRRVTLIVVLGCFLLLGLEASMSGQTATAGAVLGAITDSRGAVVSTAQVELENPSTKSILHTTAGPDGHYTFTSVQPGEYRVRVTAQGFQTRCLP